MSMMAFKPDALLGLQNSRLPFQLLNTDSSDSREHLNLKSRASLFLSIIPNLYVKSQYGAARQSNRTPAKLLVCGYSRRCSSTPTKLSAIRGESHSRTFLVITATPLETIRSVGLSTPSSDSVARQARTIRSGFAPSTIDVSPNDTKHRIRIGDTSSGDIKIIFLISLSACILSSSFFSSISKLRQTKYGS